MMKHGRTSNQDDLPTAVWETPDEAEKARAKQKQLDEVNRARIAKGMAPLNLVELKEGRWFEAFLFLTPVIMIALFYVWFRFS